VSFRSQSGRASNAPIRSRQSPYPNGSADASEKPSRWTVPAEPTSVSAPNQVAKMENVTST
jgi:hypothetical protein